MEDTGLCNQRAALRILPPQYHNITKIILKLYDVQSQIHSCDMAVDEHMTTGLHFLPRYKTYDTSVWSEPQNFIKFMTTHHKGDFSSWFMQMKSHSLCLLHLVYWAHWVSSHRRFLYNSHSTCLTSTHFITYQVFHFPTATIIILVFIIPERKFVVQWTFIHSTQRQREKRQLITNKYTLNIWNTVEPNW